MTVTDRGFLEWITRVRPGTATFRFSPCPRQVDRVVRCALKDEVTITYQ
jgi:hypothetical protein